MKVLFLISLFTCTVLAFPKEDGCTFCREGVQKLMDLALDTEAQQEYLLVYGVNLLLFPLFEWLHKMNFLLSSCQPLGDFDLKC